jgi:hypothetical protein
MLPSFLEILFIDDVHRSTEKAIQLIYNTLFEKLSRTNTASTDDNDDGDYRGRRRMRMEWCRRMFRTIGTKLAIEIQSFVRFGIERTCLQWYDATLAEKIYRVRRNVVVQQPTPSLLSPLKNTDRNKLAFLLAWISYLRQRFQPNEKNETSMMTNTNGTTTVSRQRMIPQYFRQNMIPVLLSIWDAWDIYYHWKYLLGLTNYTHVINRLLGHIVRRNTQQDLESNNTNLSLTQKRSTSSTSAQPKHWDSSSHQQIATLASMATIMMVSISWGTQLRAWYEERVHQRQSIPPLEDAATTILLPPPPARRAASSSSSKNHHRDRIIRGCGVCGRTVRIHPTTCRPTGLVFCKSCIYKHVRKRGQCPVTGIPLSEKTDLVGLYEPSPEQNTTGT